MSPQTTLPSPPQTAGKTERFDSIACLDERVRHDATTAIPTEPGRYLEVQGPERSLTITLGGGAVRIGRGLAADLRLDDMSVSRRHAILLVGSGSARVLDERSSNGTYLNGMPVQQAELSDGDVIVLGRVVLRYLEVAARRRRAAGGVLGGPRGRRRARADPERAATTEGQARTRGFGCYDPAFKADR